MAVIFKDFIKEKSLIAFKFVKENRIIVKFTSFALIAVLSLVVSIVACGITLGFKVKYSGKNIAVVRNTAVFDRAKDLVLENINDKDSAKAIEKPEFSLTITINDKIDSETKLADAIIENTNNLTKGYALKVNGEAFVFTTYSEMGVYLEEARNRYFITGAQNEADFVDKLSIEEGYYLISGMDNEQEAKAKIDTLKIKTVSTVTTDSEIAYTTKTVNNADKYLGETRIVNSGAKGLSRKVETVETINGAETARVELSNEVIKQPVQRVVEKGTKVAYTTATEKAEATAAGFIRPMNKSHVKKITAYWGDGRGHKGIDLAGDTGSPIFAAKAGTVVFSGMDGNYGYAVVIDHGNGFQTRYAHCSSLCVKKGETVTQGQQVAKLGNTGRSTGPHLHFEILVNGSQVNPVKYINF